MGTASGAGPSALASGRPIGCIQAVLLDDSPGAGLRLVPLGGLGEVGMNCLGIESSGGVVLVDCGVTFPADGLGVDIARPRFDYVFERQEQLRGIVITHGHEDHIGALPYLLDALDPTIPIWGPPHALTLVRKRLEEWGLAREAVLRTTSPGVRFDVAGLEFEPIRVTHSITEATALAIRGAGQTILHTGDFKLDPHPADGERTDEDRLRAIGDEGVRVLLSDSTNVDSPGESTSELEVGEALLRCVLEERQRVVVGLFASNVQRLLHIGRVARLSRRRVVLLGRSLETHVAAAVAVGKLDWPSDLILPVEMARGTARERVLVLATGTQGEPSAALARLAGGTHPRLALEPGDAVFLSSRVIPGCERAVHEVMAGLLRRGVRVVSRAHEPKIHASGHAHRGELLRMMELVRPRGFIPVHGTLHHLHRHADLARSQGISDVVVAENGDVVAVDDGPLRKTGRAPSGRVYADERRTVPTEVLDERRKLARAGVLFTQVVLDEGGRRIAQPTVTGMGVLTRDEGDVLVRASEAAAHAWDRAIAEQRAEAGCADAVRLAVRTLVEGQVGTRTQVLVTVTRARVP
jgi:ribonuclease J